MSWSNIQLKVKQGVPSPFQRQEKYVRYVTYFPVPLDICVTQCVTMSVTKVALYFTLRRLNKNFIMNGCNLYTNHISYANKLGILLGLSVSVWSIPDRQQKMNV